MAGRQEIRRHPIEWPTWLLLFVCYAAWFLAVSGVLYLWLSIGLLALTLTLHSSLQHEALHGHPTRNGQTNEALVYPALGLLIAYRRFKDTHLAHHRDEILTDPYDDPETNYLDPAVWHRSPAPLQAILRANNTLLGRILVGPAIGLIWYYRGELRGLLSGDRRIANAYLHHSLGLLQTIAGLWTFGAMPIWAYLLGAYIALGILRVRTFLEHRAHADCPGRTVIVEDRGPLSWLFLNNNLHAVHHRHPRTAWYELPKRYAAESEQFLRGNGHYRYRSYLEIFRLYWRRAKDPVPHPLWPNP